MFYIINYYLWVGSNYKSIKKTLKKTWRVRENMQGRNKFRTLFSNLVFRLHWRRCGWRPLDGRELSWVALGWSWSAVPGQNISSLAQAGGCRWVGPQKRLRFWEPVSSGVLIRRAAMKRSLTWRQPGAPRECVHHRTPPYNTNGSPAVERRRRDNWKHTVTRKKRPFLLQCPSSTLYWRHWTSCRLQRRNVEGSSPLLHKYWRIHFGAERQQTDNWRTHTLCKYQVFSPVLTSAMVAENKGKNVEWLMLHQIH